MKTITRGGNSSHQLNRVLTRAIIVAGFLFGVLPGVHAYSIDPGGGGTNSGPTYIPLDSWSFYDSTNWTSDKSYAPVSFTNLDYSYLGNGSSLVLDSTNPAWLHYNVHESDGTTNLTLSAGTVTFWFAPGSWSSTNSGGTGPGEWRRLLEVGGYTPDSSYGLWSIYVDDVGANIYFSTQTNDLSSNLTTYVSAPIAWTTNYFHFVALTYSATNTALYLDGGLAATGPPITIYPGSNVLAKGFYIGSASNGVYQAHGMFNSVYTYNVPLDADTIAEIFNYDYGWYMMSPWNSAMFKLSSGNSSPSTTTPNVITGQGNLQILGAAPTCSYGTNAFQVWITNITATVASDGTMAVTFAIEGGQDGYYYDVFAGTPLTSPLSNGYWTWQGQGQHCLVYSMTGLPQGTVFLILGTPLDTDGDGLTDAYENLVSHTDPNNAYSNLDGILDGWEILLGLNPQNSNFTSPSQRANYGYTTSDWLNAVTGIRSGGITTDNEGNVQTVSQ